MVNNYENFGRFKKRLKKHYKKLDKNDFISSKTCLYTKSKVDLWKESEEGQYMKKHCLKQYYETIQEIEKRRN